MISPLERAYNAVTEAVYAENAAGGEARDLLLQIGRLVGVDLTKDIGGTWEPANMRRVFEGVRARLAPVEHIDIKVVSVRDQQAMDAEVRHP